MNNWHKNGIGEQEIEPPDLSTKVTAFRSWLWKDGVPVSLAAEEKWDEPVMQAVCNQKTALHLQRPTWKTLLFRFFGIALPYKKQKIDLHFAPYHDCSCGLYGMFDLRQTQRYAPLPLVGICEFWGQTEVHQNGIRAQYAQIKAISLTDNALSVQQEKTAKKDAYLLASFLCLMVLGFFAFMTVAFSSIFAFLAWLSGAFLVVCSVLAVLFIWNLQFYPSFAASAEQVQEWCEKNNVIFCKHPFQLQQFHTSPLPRSLQPASHFES